MHSSNHIIKFTDVTAVVEKVVEFRRAQSGHSPLYIDGSSVELIKSTKFLGVHLVENFTWSLNTSSITKKAQQCLYFLQRLRRAHLSPPILTMYYSGTIKSILSSCITAWFGNCTVLDRKTLQRIVRTAEKIIGVSLPSITDIYTTCCICQSGSSKAMVNTYFQKREEHRVTYKSGGRSTQVDYILCRRGNLKEISDCKVVVGESVARQHRMVVCRMTLMVCKKKRSKIEIEKTTKWWKLKKEECCEEFRQKLRQALGGQVVLPDDWETTAEVIRVTRRKVLGVSSGRRKEDKET
ncbi:hypothetical protein QTP86_007518 [Hemibagrus guttatus]|nr:hypothetical protein QTP86_007518 [Hemibagrus guttatus]